MDAGIDAGIHVSDIIWAPRCRLGATHEESSFYKALHSSSVVGTAMILDEPPGEAWRGLNVYRPRYDYQSLQYHIPTIYVYICIYKYTHSDMILVII